jgi:hypothetical protein
MKETSSSPGQQSLAGVRSDRERVRAVHRSVRQQKLIPVDAEPSIVLPDIVVTESGGLSIRMEALDLDRVR